MSKFQYQQTYLALLCLFQLAMPFAVITPHSTVPSALIDGPQTRYTTTNSSAHTDPQEQEAVYNVMRATGNDWAIDIPDVCRGRWHGIECMPDNDNIFHVVSLSFGALSDDTAFPTCDPRHSYISDSITRLPHIRSLFFYRCFSHRPQSIPLFLGRLGLNLQTLVLRDNGLVGPIPTELGNLTRLKVLDLHKNNLNGSIPSSLARLSGLKLLDLSGNRLTGSVPGFTFPLLNVLDLNQNILTGPFPSSISACQSLIKMDFSHNRLTGPIPESVNLLENLILLDLSYNRLLGPFPSSLKGLSSLQALILKENPMVSTTLPDDAFDGLVNLTILIFSNMDLNGPIPNSLGRLPNLHVVHLDRNSLNGSIPDSFRDFRHLSELRLNNNHLIGPVPFGRETVWRMRRKLRLRNNAGLCLKPNSGLQDVLGSTSDSGLGLCDPH